MGRYSNNRGMFVNILRATNTGNKEELPFLCDGRHPLKRDNNIEETVFSTWSAPSKRMEI
jgi:hypothetical protein